MKKKKKQLILLVVVLCVCILAIVGYYVGRNAKDKNDAQAQAEETIYLGSLSDCVYVDFSGQDGNAYACTYNSDSGLWQLDADPDFQVDASYMDTVMGKVVGLTAYRRLDMVDDLSLYGLDNPTAALTVRDSQGNNLTLSFGDFNNGKYYVLAEGYDNIFTVGSTVFDAVNYGAVDIMVIETIPVMDEAHLKSFVIETQDSAATFEKETEETTDEDGNVADTYTWFRVAPDGTRTLVGDDSEFSNCLYYLSIETFISTEIFKYTPDDFAQYGLDEPTLLLTANYVDENGADSTFTLRAGDYIGLGDDTAAYFTTIDGSNAIYRMSTSFVNNYYTVATGSAPDTGTETDNGGIDIAYQQPD